MSLLSPVHRSPKGGGGTLLCGFLGVFLAIAGLAAQEVRDTIGPIEKQAQANPIKGLCGHINRLSPIR